MLNYIRKEELDKIFLKYFTITFLTFISALNFNFFINPSKIVAGGVSGIAILTQEIFNLSPATVILVISVAILLFGLLFSEYEMVASALYVSFLYPFFVNITSNIINVVQIEYTDLLVISIFAGIISGIVSGFTCKMGMSSGGIILISQVLHKKIRRPISTINLIMNATIVIIGGVVFGTLNLMYAVILLYTNKLVMDKIIMGTSEMKIFYIITDEEEKILDYIKTELSNKYTIFNARGGYKFEKRSVIMTSIPTNDYFKLKEGIHKIDKEAFFIITDSYQASGRKQKANMI